VYQLVVVAVASLSGMPLEAAGRATSLGFFYATLGVAFLLMSDLGVSPWNRLLVLGLWLLSPHYIFWSRTFMVESTALFLCSLYLLLAVRFVSRAHPLYAIGAVLAGVLGAAVKPITVVPFIVLRQSAVVPLRGPGGSLVSGALVVLCRSSGDECGGACGQLEGPDTNPLAWGIASGQLFRDGSCPAAPA
jgi:hypothetical protein